MEEKETILKKAQARVSYEAARLLEERLQHALEEALDLLQYLEWAKQVTPEGLEARLDELCALAAEVANALAQMNAYDPPDDPGEWVEWQNLEGPELPPEF